MKPKFYAEMLVKLKKNTMRLAAEIVSPIVGSSGNGFGSNDSTTS